jgi:glycerol-3-phosphate dehydrogenase
VPLIEAAAPEKRAPLSDVIPLCEAEISHAIQSEHARSSTDVLARRCRLAMVDFAEAYLAQSGLVSGATSTSPMSHQLNP